MTNEGVLPLPAALRQVSSHERPELGTESDEHRLVVGADRQAGADPGAAGGATTNGSAIGRSLVVTAIPCGRRLSGPRSAGRSAARRILKTLGPDNRRSTMNSKKTAAAA